VHPDYNISLFFGRVFAFAPWCMVCSILEQSIVQAFVGKYLNPRIEEQAAYL